METKTKPKRNMITTIMLTKKIQTTMSMIKTRALEKLRDEAKKYKADVILMLFKKLAE
jgi:hypothetical protein